MKKHKFIKPVIAVAACAALVLGVSKIPDFHKNTNQTEKNRTENAGIMEELDHAFTVKVMAAEKKDGKESEKEIPLKKDVPVVPSITIRDECWGGDPDTNEISYCIGAPLFCEGKNIKKITYSINKGAFQIFYKKGSGFLLDGKKCKGYNVGASTPRGYDIEDEEGRIGVNFEEGYYTSYTVSPDFQKSEDVKVNICNVVKIPEKSFKLFWDLDRTLEDSKKIREQILDDLTITCEVTYTDDTKDSVDIAVGSVIMTPEEAGFFPTEEEIPLPEKNGKSVFTTFQMK